MGIRIVYCDTWTTTAKKAASFAALIHDRVGLPVELEKGRQGQFDVLVNGRSVASRKGGLLAKIMNRPWPSGDDVVAAVRAAMQQGGEWGGLSPLHMGPVAVGDVWIGPAKLSMFVRVVSERGFSRKYGAYSRGISKEFIPWATGGSSGLAPLRCARR